MLSDDQLSLARGRFAALAGELVLRLDAGSDPADRMARALEELAGELCDASRGKLSLTRARAARHPGLPSLSVENVQYLALPAGVELEPFLDLLAGLASRPSAPETIAPCFIEVLIAPTCPSCPAAVAACTALAGQHPGVALSVIDAQYFPALAGALQSVPAVIVDGERTLLGQVSADELGQVLRERGSPGYVRSALASMIAAGRFAEAVRALRDDAWLAALAELLRSGAMQERLGVMLLAERALEREPHALDAALPHVLPLLDSADAALRGDAADLLGRIAAPGARAALERLLADENPDVREIAEEGLGRLRSPS
jgi:hypothetical protein